MSAANSFIHSFTKFRNSSVGSELTNDIRLLHAEMCPKSQRLNSSPMHWEWSVFRSWCLGHISDRWSPSSLVKLADLLTSWFNLQELRSKDHVEAISKPSLQFFAIYKSPITMLQGEDCENLGLLGPIRSSWVFFHLKKTGIQGKLHSNIFFHLNETIIFPHSPVG